MAVASGGAFEWGRDWKSQDLCRSNKCTSAVWNRIVCLRTTKSHHRFLTDSDFGEQCRTCGEFITDLGRQRPHILDACEDTSTFTFKTGSCAECTPEFRGKLKLRRPRVRQLPRCHARAPSSIFYFCVVRPGSAETPLVQMQARLAEMSGYSFTIYSNVSQIKGIAQSVVPAVRGPMQTVRGGRYGTALNTHIFFAVWRQIWREGRHISHDWIVKFDTDTAMLPWRLQDLLASANPSEPLVLGNAPGTWDQCPGGHDEDAENPCAVHGPIEVMSRGAASLFFRGMKMCDTVLDSDRYSEDTFLNACTRLVGAKVVPEPQLLEEHGSGVVNYWVFPPHQTPFFHGKLPNCSSLGIAAFHAFKYDVALGECVEKALLTDMSHAPCQERHRGHMRIGHSDEAGGEARRQRGQRRGRLPHGHGEDARQGGPESGPALGVAEGARHQAGPVATVTPQPPSWHTCWEGALQAPCESCSSCTHAWCVQRGCEAEGGCNAGNQWQTVPPSRVSRSLEQLKSLVLMPGRRDTLYDKWARGVSRASRSTQGPLRVLRITGPKKDGFWVRVINVLNQAAWAVLHGLPFYVIHNHVDDSYYDPAYGGNSWTEYFEPVGGGVDMMHARAANGTRALGGEGQEVTIVELGCASVHQLFVELDAIYPRDKELAERARASRAFYVSKFVRPTPEIRARVDRWWSTHITTGGPHRDVVLGVHVRGTDKYLSEVIPPERYFALIDAYIRYHEGLGPADPIPQWSTPHRRSRRPPSGHHVVIFFATDDRHFAQTMAGRYGLRVLMNGEVMRTTRGNAIWREIDRSKNHRRGVEVIMDTLLLSKCDFLLKGASAVAEFAIYFNPDLALSSYDFQLRGQELPKWARADWRSGAPIHPTLSLPPGSPPPPPGSLPPGSIKSAEWLHARTWSPIGSSSPPRVQHPRCIPNPDESERRLAGGRRVLLHGVMGLLSNQLRCLANAITFAARLKAQLVLDHRWGAGRGAGWDHRWDTGGITGGIQVGYRWDLGRT